MSLKTGSQENIQGALELNLPDNVNNGDNVYYPPKVATQSFSGIQWRSSSTPKYHIHLFSISERTFSNVGNTKIVIPGISVPDREGKIVKTTLPGLENKPYRYITSFPQPMLFPRTNFDTNEVELIEQDVRRFIVSLISPDMALAGAVTLDNPVNVANAFSQGLDLSKSGVFFDYTEIPSEVALKKAYDRMDKYYHALLERARTLGLTNKAVFEEELKTNPDYSCAAEYMGEDFEWHKKSTRAVTCSNCGEKKSTTKPFHRTKEGYLCVDPSKDAWKQAYNVGFVQKERVPEDFQWWTPKKGAAKFIEDEEV